MPERQAGSAGSSWNHGNRPENPPFHLPAVTISSEMVTAKCGS